MINSIPCNNFMIIPEFYKTPNSFKNVFYDTCDLEEEKSSIIIKELSDIQIEANENGEYSLSNTVINNAIRILMLIIKENIEIPHLASNPMKQISFTWDTVYRRIYVTVDELGKIGFTSVELNMPNKYLSAIGYMDNINEIITRIKHDL